MTSFFSRRVLNNAIGYHFQQVSPVPVWTISHNLGYYVDVATYSVGGAEIQGSVVQMSENVVTVSFNTPTAGFARIT